MLIKITLCFFGLSKAGQLAIKDCFLILIIILTYLCSRFLIFACYFVCIAFNVHCMYILA